MATPTTTVSLPANNAAATNTQAAQNLQGTGELLALQDKVNKDAADKAMYAALVTKYSAETPKYAGKTSVGQSIGIISNILNAKTNRVADLSIAISDYMAKTGTTNHPALIKLQQEAAINEVINNLMKSLFEKNQQSVNAWTQLRT